MTGIHPTPSPPSEQRRVQPLGHIGLSALRRARGHSRIGFVNVNGKTRLGTNFQSGSAKIRLPRTTPGRVMEAVLLNTAGGVTGGDHLVYEVDAESDSCATVSTQAAERIYRRAAGEARIESRLTVGCRARLDWLPQETIVFDRSALSRRLDADVAADATLLAAEAIILGRKAMGETAPNVLINDRWRVRRAGRLVFADGFRVEGNAGAIMSGAATGTGAMAYATVILLAPDAEGHLEAARAALANCQGESGASAWNGLLVARLTGATGEALRSDLVALIERLRGVAMPRVWNC